LSESKVIKNKKIFNIHGPCIADEHYMLQALVRQTKVQQLIEDKQYFVLHAPRQSGKTTFLQAMTDEINAKGQYYALFCSLSTLSKAKDDDTMAKRVVNQLRIAASVLQDTAKAWSPAVIESSDSYVRETLSNLCVRLDKPLIVFFDEADSVNGDPLITLLQQLRDGYISRTKIPFPRSIALNGMRNIRDYIAKVRPDYESIGTASPFNIASPLTLSNFTMDEIGLLYGQHTEATGQIFEPKAIDRAWYWTEGQPWLVNALAKQAIEEDLKYDYSKTITATHINAAAEALILRRDTHIDSLLERMKEPRVWKVIKPILTGAENSVPLRSDDTIYCQDLGLIKYEGNAVLKPANTIYSEVIIRTLTYELQEELPADLKNKWVDGKNINMTALIKGFQAYWRQTCKIWLARFGYKEEGPHLVFHAFMQKIANGTALVQREQALNKGRVNVCVNCKDKNYPI
jgi:type II secretory pathway predicted ATPase ExeA